jgi:hypothetical protein
MTAKPAQNLHPQDLDGYGHLDAPVVSPLWTNLLLFKGEKVVRERVTYHSEEAARAAIEALEAALKAAGKRGYKIKPFDQLAENYMCSFQMPVMRGL